MLRTISYSAILALYIFLSGCPASNPSLTLPATYPGEISNFGNTENFPLRSMGYERWKVLAYEPGMTNYSITYNRFDQDLQNGVTLYFYPRTPGVVEQVGAAILQGLKAHPDGSLRYLVEMIQQKQIALEKKEGTSYQVAAEISQILQAHPGGSLIQQREIALEKAGTSYQAVVATFRYQELFAGRRQEVSSQLVLVPMGNRFFKVRSSAPYTQASVAEESMFRLLGTVGWQLAPSQ